MLDFNDFIIVSIFCLFTFYVNTTFQKFIVFIYLNQLFSWIVKLAVYNSNKNARNNNFRDLNIFLIISFTTTHFLKICPKII